MISVLIGLFFQKAVFNKYSNKLKALLTFHAEAFSDYINAKRAVFHCQHNPSEGKFWCAVANKNMAKRDNIIADFINKVSIINITSSHASFKLYFLHSEHLTRL